MATRSYFSTKNVLTLTIEYTVPLDQIDLSFWYTWKIPLQNGVFRVCVCMCVSVQSPFLFFPPIPVQFLLHADFPPTPPPPPPLSWIWHAKHTHTHTHTYTHIYTHTYATRIPVCPETNSKGKKEKFGGTQNQVESDVGSRVYQRRV